MVVFENNAVEFAREREERPTVLFAHRNAGRILERRIGVDEARPITDQMVFEDFKIHSVALERHLETASATAAQGVERTVIGPLLDDDGGTGRNKSPDR